MTLSALDPAASAASRQTFLAVLTTSLAEEGATAAADPLAAAASLYAQHSSAGASLALRQSHEAAWASLHASRIELAGAVGDETARGVAAAVNSSMYYLLSAAREDWPFSTSPGGLANNAYLGKSVWF
jgi:hypothetical protein